MRARLRKYKGIRNKKKAYAVVHTPLLYLKLNIKRNQIADENR